MSRPPCYYCDGTGWLEDAVRIDVDDYRDAECGWCEGTGKAMHSANTRTSWVGPAYWIGGCQIGDPLVLLARMRHAYLRNRGGWKMPYTAANYGEMRALAVSPLDRPLPDAPVAFRMAEAA